MRIGAEQVGHEKRKRTGSDGYTQRKVETQRSRPSDHEAKSSNKRNSRKKNTKKREVKKIETLQYENREPQAETSPHKVRKQKN